MCPDSDIDGVSVLTEQNFTQNLKFVIGEDCPFFGKLFYLYFAKGYDKAKITLAQFYNGLKPYTQDENRKEHHKASFSLLDTDRDNRLNIINLTCLFRNLPSNSRLG